MDADALVQNEIPEASAIKAVRIPGVDMAEKWLGSCTFAAKDWAGNDQFNRVETDRKAAGACVTWLA
jgi:hypothetical protein